EIIEIRFATSRRARCADCAVDIQPRAEDRRIAETSRNLPRESTGRRDAADLTARVDAVAVDRAVQVLFTQFSLGQHLECDAMTSFGALLRIEIVLRVGASF